jgi:ABC-type branched-subunit amino acid transport system substrate-binding protein
VHEYLPELQTVVFLGQDTATALLGREQAKYAIENYMEAEILDEVLVQPNTVDFYPYLTDVLDKNPDAIAQLVGGQGTQALLLKQSKELGFKGQNLGSNSGDPTTFCEVAGLEYTEGYLNNEPVYDSDIWPQETQDLIADYYRAFGEGEMFGLCHYLGYGSIMLYQQMMEYAQSIDPDDILAVFDDPTFTYEWFGVTGKQLGGFERFGTRRVNFGYTSLSTVDDNCNKVAISKMLCPCP